MNTNSEQIMLPEKDFTGFEIKDLKQVKDILASQANSRNSREMSAWFRISYQNQNYSYFQCKASSTCNACIKLKYTKGRGFTVVQIQSKHDHKSTFTQDETKLKQIKSNNRDFLLKQDSYRQSKQILQIPKYLNQILQQLKNHHILSPFIANFKPSKLIKNVMEGTYIAKTKCSCRITENKTAIAYEITNFKGETILQNSMKFENITSNQAQFKAMMYAMLECFVNGIKSLQIKNRSQLAVAYINGLKKIKNPGLVEIAEATKLLAVRLKMNLVYTFIGKNDSSLKLQNMCRKLLDSK